MTRPIDHVVIAVNDLPSAIATFTEFGFTVQPGGEHAHRGSHNALVTFADGAYIEIIAFQDPDLVRDDLWFRILQTGEGWVDVAVLSSDLEGDVAALEEAGIANTGIRPGGRRRPDGQQVDWRSARTDPTPAGRVPFVIDDVTPRDLRVPGGEPVVHPNHVTGVVGVTSMVADLDPIAAVHERLFGLGNSVDQVAGEPVIGRRYTAGPHWLEIVQPKSADGLLGQHLARRGPTPWEVTFCVDSGSTATTVDPMVIHGARFCFISGDDILTS